MAQTHIEADVAIIGAGVTGLTLALLAARLGHQVVLIDKAPMPPPTAADGVDEGRTVALLQGSLNILAAAGLEDPRALGTPLQVMELRRPRVPPMRFRASDAVGDAFGHNIAIGRLAAGLADLARMQALIQICAPAELQRIDPGPDAVTLQLDTGAVTTRLLVGADGRSSATRAQLRIPTWQRPYGQTALTFAIAHDRPHGHVSTEWHRAGGPLTLVPLPGNRSSVVWVEDDATARRLRDGSRSALQSTLQDIVGGTRGTVTIETDPMAYPLSAVVARRLTARRGVLVGEAAHGLHPIGAQGLNLSLRDVATLAEFLGEARERARDPGSRDLLRRYALRRWPDTASRALATDRLNALCRLQGPLGTVLAGTGLGVMRGVGPLRRTLMRAGMRDPLGQPRLAAGLPI